MTTVGHNVDVKAGDTTLLYLGGAYLTLVGGQFYGQNTGPFLDVNGNTFSGATQLFASLRNADGSLNWTYVFGFGASSSAYGGSVAAQAGALFFAGWGSGTFPDSSSTLGNDGFVERLAMNGSVAWSTRIQLSRT